MEQAMKMVPGTKNKEPFPLLVPITAQTAKDPRPVVERVRSDADLRLAKGDDLALEIRELWLVHQNTSSDWIVLRAYYTRWISDDSPTIPRLFPDFKRARPADAFSRP